MLEKLTNAFSDVVRNVTGKAKISEKNIEEAVDKIKMALLEADVNLRVVRRFVNSTIEEAKGEKVLRSVDPGQQFIKIVHDKIVALLGDSKTDLHLKGPDTQSVILFLGLQGSGKTTSSAKLAVKLKKEGKNPLLVACDVYRPAAVTQLKTLGQEIGCEVFSIDGSTDVQNIVQSAINYAKDNGFNVVILDTAGRLQIDTDMMAELLIIDRVFRPHEKLLVIDAMTGQEAVHVAENFDAQIGLTGLILTKLDGDSRGGSALSVVHCTGKPIKLTGTGEKLNALEDFYPERMVTRILGMGDIVSLVERAQEVFDEKEALKMQEKMQKAEFSFNDFLNMKKQMQMFGSMDQILGMLPGVNLKQADREKISHATDTEFKKIEVFIQSMTPQEREHPELMNTSRKKRIAKGCGMDMHTVNVYVKQFEQMRQMMGGMNKMQKMFSGFGKKNEKQAMVQAMKMMRKFK